MRSELLLRTQNYLRFLSGKIENRPLILPVLLSITAGIFSYEYETYYLLVGVVIAYIFFVSFRKNKSYSLLVILTASVALSVFVGTRVISVVSDKEIASCGEGVVSSCVGKLNGRYEVIVTTDEGNRVLVKTDERFSIGDEIQYSNCRIPESSSNPGAIDYRDYLRRKNIVGTATSINLIKSSSEYLRIVDVFKRFCERLRFLVFENISQGLDTKTQGLMAAVFLGDKSLLDEKDAYLFQHSGCAHILAVSGTHISSFLVLLPYVLNNVVKSKGKRTWCYALFCILLGCFTGWSESVTRACIMSICSYASRDYLSGMSFAALLMIIANPFTVLSTGFQMSFAASLGIYLLTPIITNRLGRLRVNTSVTAMVSSYLAVQISMLPFYTISSTHIGIFNIIAQVINNSLAGLACVMFVPTAIMSFIPVAGEMFSYITSFPLRLIALMAGVAARLMRYSLNLSFIGKNLMILVFIGLIIYLMPRSDFRKVVSEIWLVVIAFVVIAKVINNLNEPEARVVFIDVGQGDCCLIMAGGQSCLIDTGVADKAIYNVLPVLDYYGIDQVDYCIASHWDLDHAGGIGVLSDLGRISNVYSSCNSIPDEVTSVWEGSVDVIELHAGDVLVFDGDTSMEIISPEVAFTGDNEESLVMMFHSMDTDILFTGDIGEVTENTLIEEVSVDADILKVAHHGSRYSSSERFLECISPQLAVISVGKYNFYGHPSDEVINRLENQSIDILRTDISGAVICEIYANEYRVRTCR